MRAVLVGMAVLGGWLLVTPGGRAGVYNPDEPPSLESALEPPYKLVGRPASDETVWKRLAELRGLDDRLNKPDRATPGHKVYRQQAEDLERLRRDGALGVPQYVSLGGCLLRLGQTGQAQVVLEEGLRRASPDDPARFLLLLNLAAANMEPNELLPRAVDYQRQALAAWPAVWAGWDREEWYWYRRVETFTLTLLQARQREAILSGGRGGGFTTPDALFPKVRFVGPSGEYEAGAIAFASWNELPADAEMIVLQMVLSHSNDARLLWLYGELLNARGDVDSAFHMLSFLEEGMSLSNIRELHKHRAVLKYARPVFQALGKSGTKERLLWAVAARGMPVPAGVGGGLIDVTVLGAAFAPPGAKEAALPPPAPRSVSRLPDWQTLLVGFGAGVLAAALGFLQWAELRRRRRVARGPQDNGRSQAAPARSQGQRTH